MYIQDKLSISKCFSRVNIFAMNNYISNLSLLPFYYDKVLENRFKVHCVLYTRTQSNDSVISSNGIKIILYYHILSSSCFGMNGPAWTE